MPIYEFECAKCGAVTEVFQRMGDAPPECKDCGGPTSKLISHSSFILKGGGWYADGYSGGKSGSKVSADVSTDSSSSGSTTSASSSDGVSSETSAAASP